MSSRSAITAADQTPYLFGQWCYEEIFHVPTLTIGQKFYHLQLLFPRVDTTFSIPLSLCGLWKHTPISGPMASIWCLKVPNSKSGKSLLKWNYQLFEWKLSSVSNFSLSNPIAEIIFCVFWLDPNTHFRFEWRSEREKNVLKRWIRFVLARILNNAVHSQSKHNSLSRLSTY